MQNHFKQLLQKQIFLDEEMRWKVEQGDFVVKIGAASNDIRLEKRVRLKKDLFVDGKTRGFYAKAES